MNHFSDRVSGKSTISRFINCPCLNPHWPLHFEKLKGASESEMASDLAEKVSAGDEIQGLIEHPELFTATNGSKICEATTVALSAYGTEDAGEAVTIARKALETFPICPEAYNILALYEAETFEEALQHFQQAELLGTRVCSDADLKKHTNSGKMLSFLPLRAYYRALFGVGNTLRKLRRYKEALPYYEKLLKLQKSSLLSGTLMLSSLEPKAHLPEIWLNVYGAEKCLELAADFSGSRCAAFNSCAVPWMANLSLALFQAGFESPGAFVLDPKDPKKSKLPSAFGTLHEIDDVRSYSANLYAPLHFLAQAPKVAELLLGSRKMPRGNVPQILGNPDSLKQAVAYVHSCGHLWRDTPKALEHLQTYYTSSKLGKMFLDVAEGRTQQLDVESAIMLMNEGHEPNYFVFDASELTRLLHVAMFLKESAPVIVKRLLKDGAFVSLVNSLTSSALHYACYYGVGRELVRLLAVDSKNKMPCSEAPLQPEDTGTVASPLEMATEQLNWAEIDECLNIIKPERKTPNLLLTLFKVLLNSDVLVCMAGGQKCERCIRNPFAGNQRHGSSVNFRKCVDVLVQHGLEKDDAEPLIRKKRKYDSRKPGVKDLLEYVEQVFRIESSEGMESPSAASLGSGSKKVKACNRCGKTAEDTGKRLKICLGCRKVWYCCSECQKQDWKKDHKVQCKILQGER